MKKTLLTAGMLLLAAGLAFADGQPRRTDGSSPVTQQDSASPEIPAQNALLRKLTAGNRTASPQKEQTFEQFKRQLLNRISQTPEIRNLYFWLHGPADADELLHGILTTRQYGKFTDTWNPPFAENS